MVVEHNDHADDWEDTADKGTSLGCIERWRTGPEEQKKMFSLFEELVSSLPHAVISWFYLLAI